VKEERGQLAFPKKGQDLHMGFEKGKKERPALIKVLVHEHEERRHVLDKAVVFAMGQGENGA